MPIDLVQAAHQLMRKNGFEPSFSEAVQREAAALPERLPVAGHSEIADLRHLPWSSIDNRESRDLDQVEYAERQADGTIRLLIAVADVSSRVPAASAIDQRAAANTVSVYTGVVVFPMLPERLSADLTSLLPSRDRLAVVIELLVNREGDLASMQLFRAVVSNHAKLDYAAAGAWLEGSGALPDALVERPELQEQLRLQQEAAQRLERARQLAGALNLETVEARPVIANGRVIDIALVEPNRARALVENFMVAANVAMAGFLLDHQMPAIRRVVRTPRRWGRIVELAAEIGEPLPAQPDSKALSAFLERRRQADPAHAADLTLSVVKLLGPGEYVPDRNSSNEADDGHFGLAVTEYTHSTAPNRRYPDLIIQRLARAALASAPAPYSDAELEDIARHCTLQEDAARKVERAMRKMAAAVLLSDRIGDSFPALVTGASDKGTYVRVLRPPVEGRVVRGAEGLDVGETVRFRLIAVDVERGYIDFETEAAGRDRKRARARHKKAVAATLAGRIGQQFQAVVTGASERGVWVRTADGVEGRVVRGANGLEPGQSVEVRLLDADAVHGFIDVERIDAQSSRKQQRAQRKQQQATRLQSRIGQRMPAVVSGVTRKAIWVRTQDGIEGRLVRGWQGLTPGSTIDVILLAVDARRGFIDFARG